MNHIELLKQDLKTVKTDKQAIKAIHKNGFTIKRDDTNKYNSFSVWLDDYTRIYKRHLVKDYVLQKWEKVNFKYSGIPVFFG